MRRRGLSKCHNRRTYDYADLERFILAQLPAAVGAQERKAMADRTSGPARASEAVATAVANVADLERQLENISAAIAGGAGQSLWTLHAKLETSLAAAKRKLDDAEAAVRSATSEPGEADLGGVARRLCRNPKAAPPSPPSSGAWYPNSGATMPGGVVVRTTNGAKITGISRPAHPAPKPSPGRFYDGVRRVKDVVASDLSDPVDGSIARASDIVHAMTTRTLSGYRRAPPDRRPSSIPERVAMSNPSESRKAMLARAAREEVESYVADYLRTGVAPPNGKKPVAPTTAQLLMGLPYFRGRVRHRFHARRPHPAVFGRRWKTLSPATRRHIEALANGCDRVEERLKKVAKGCGRSRESGGLCARTYRRRRPRASPRQPLPRGRGRRRGDARDSPAPSRSRRAPPDAGAQPRLFWHQIELVGGRCFTCRRRTL